MPDSAADLIYDEELDTSPEVLNLLLRRRTSSAALASPPAHRAEPRDDTHHHRSPTRVHPVWL